MTNITTPDLAAGAGRATFTRRQVLAGLTGLGVVTIVGTGTLRAFAAPGAQDNPVLVNVFLRGAADGLNIVVPYGDDEYYRIRTSIAQQPDTLTDLDGFFGLHGAFTPLANLYQQGELAFIHAAGSHDPSRSHFTAMDNMDLAFGSTGWMQRVLAAENRTNPISGMSIDNRISPSLRGPYGGMAVSNLNRFRRTTDQLAPLRPTLETMYGAADPLLGGTTTDAFTSVDTLRGVDSTPSVPYPNNSAGRTLAEAAALIKADIGVRMVSINVGGWDHHRDENPALTNRGTQLSEAMAAFKADLGTQSARVLTLVMTEFGRTAKENGSSGTDHGHGSIMMAMGGGLASAGGGRVHLRDDRWVGLTEGDLDRGRYLAVTTDFRSVLAEAIDRHLGFTDLGAIFPGFTPNYLGLLDADTTPPSTSTSTSTTLGPPTTLISTTTTGEPPTTSIPSTTTSTSSPTLPPARGSVSGAVSFTGGGAVGGMVVDLFESAGGGVRGQWLGDVRTDADGRYRFAADSGDYVLTFIAPPGGLFVGGRRWAQPSVTINPGQDVTDVNAQLVSGGGQDAQLGGTITGPDGGAAAEVTVDLFLAMADGSRGLWLGDTRTGADGTYRFPVAPGCYVLTFIAPTDRRFDGSGQYLDKGLCVEAGEVVSDLDAVLA